MADLADFSIELADTSIALVVFFTFVVCFVLRTVYVVSCSAVSHKSKETLLLAVFEALSQILRILYDFSAFSKGVILPFILIGAPKCEFK